MEGLVDSLGHEDGVLIFAREENGLEELHCLENFNRLCSGAGDGGVAGGNSDGVGICLLSCISIGVRISWEYQALTSASMLSSWSE